VAEKLHFSLVSPERELFSGYVDQVDAPGSEGDFGVLAGHAPFMTALREGFVTVHDGDQLHRFELQAGFADVTPEGLTILAEHSRDAGETSILG
jgi:F-type H+-transporting ATPase subunit epsilon